MKKPQIAPTSLLVLALAGEIYQSPLEKEYISRVDLGEARSIAQKLEEVYPAATTVINLRKRFVRLAIAAQLNRHPLHQVVMLGAGMDALSLYLLSTYGNSIARILEIDNGYIEEKAAIYVELVPQHDKIRFLKADITDTDTLQLLLNREGYNPAVRTIIVCEGLIYYVTSEAFIHTLSLFKTPDHRNTVAMDYGISEAEVLPQALAAHRQVMTLMTSYVGTELNVTGSSGMLKIVQTLNGHLNQLYTMADVERITYGKNEKFQQRGEGVLEMISFQL